MKRVLIEYFENQKDTEISLSKIKKYLGQKMEFDVKDLYNVLKELQLEGIIYENKNGLYMKFPSNFFITQILQTKNGKKYIMDNNDITFLNDEDTLKTQAFDDVVIEKDNKKYTLKKILKRNFPQIVCEVIIQDNVKKLKPIKKKFCDIDIGSKCMKKLTEGQLVLLNVTEEEFENKYIGEFVKVVGHKDDPDIDYKTIAYNMGFEFDFPEEALKQLESIPDEVTESDLENRVDFRDWTTFTIDGKTCKDMDDAISIKKDETGYLLGVHIADVAYYIKPNTPLFNEAIRRSTSVYFPKYVIPMFPHKISNGICSLNPNVDRLTKSTIIRFDNQGNVIDYKIVDGVIHSKKKMNYEDVNEVINGNTPEDYKAFEKDLKLMQELSSILSNIKNKRGFLALDTSEAQFQINEQNQTEKISAPSRLESENIIENFMLKSNELNAMNRYLPYIYRNHEIIDDDALSNAINELKFLGYHFQNLHNLTSNKMIQKVLISLKDKEEFFVLSKLLLQKLKKAYYGTTNVGHYGLALEYYTHSTSPIRRITDFINQYIDNIYKTQSLEDEDLKKLEEFLENVAKRASQKERLADLAEYEGDKLRNVEYAKQHIGQNIEVFIEQIHPTYLVAKSKELINFIIRYDEDLDDDINYISDNELPVLKSINNGSYYKIGDKLLIKIKEASFEENVIYAHTLNHFNKDSIVRKRIME